MKLKKEEEIEQLTEFSDITLDNLSKQELTVFFTSIGEKKFRAEQVYKWLYSKYSDDFESMTDLSKTLREKLKAHTKLTKLEVAQITRSKIDGSMKILIKLSDNNYIESVILKDSERLTGCISSQIGCRMGCKFCNTAKIGLIRNLTSGEIVRQIQLINKISLDEFGKKVSNLVFMGMGEPLDNMDNLIKALDIILDENGLGYSHRKITVSTSGVSNKIINLFELKNAPNIAISLNATTDETRNRIMPVNNKYPIKTLLTDIKKLPLQKRKRITFEYVMLKGINDSIDDAKRLIKLLKGIPSKVNLISYNITKDSEFQKISYEHILRFQKVLTDAGICALIRKSLGEDIDGACGQLYAKYLKQGGCDVN
ncbi:23S rRNA (adenine(2503)-C(2))-methyltransferase RlmN [Deferribacterales bacterium Es71-Z0220]|jgi:23S rRNA (adenine2503-C2)-methyltransferase|uniref:23S rRNA (adenine(2503)-C(2))-methyltransferase RlmN n=1 Tax=Deferrivibrio essentukiensis TaxID=2880922 RepID=UPI001F60DD36|nr:23S rRNA (adenine(2503)-C(2))-methyltransferase RlmN [Deferrivibrio essentukiensis]MBZ4672673.1 Ribosomal large subunit methyltransferase [Deferribacteraceae bacterium]MCB4204441.1 23S rRNA (adenine(2503)-C(2))-methyltransferase RlmN [Deferrivibrio essentukiensis]